MNVSDSIGGKELCNLADGYSFVLQSVLGVLAFSTLIVKRCREPMLQRRPFWIWVADTTKQALGMLEIHFVNLTLSIIFREKECVSYLVNFLLDSTIGLLLIYILLKAVSKVVACNSITPLFSGEYGEPFQFRYWLAQCAVYLLVMLVEKICVGPLILFNFWSKVEAVLPGNEKVRTALVIFIVPFIVNVLMFWIVDSILMRQTSEDASKIPSVHYHKSDAKYDKLKPEDSCSDCEVTVRSQPTSSKHRTEDAR